MPAAFCGFNTKDTKIKHHKVLEELRTLKENAFGILNIYINP
jgi:hypothetical protein